MKILALLLLAVPLAAADAPDPSLRLTPTELADYQASGDHADAALASVLDRLTLAQQQLAIVTAERDAAVTAKLKAEADLAAEKTKSAALQTQLNTAVATTKAKAETAVIAAVRAVTFP